MTCLIFKSCFCLIADGLIVFIQLFCLNFTMFLLCFLIRCKNLYRSMRKSRCDGIKNGANFRQSVWDILDSIVHRHFCSSINLNRITSYLIWVRSIVLRKFFWVVSAGASISFWILRVVNCSRTKFELNIVNMIVLCKIFVGPFWLLDWLFSLCLI